MKKLLITGFDPFDKEAINPAFEAVRGLPDTIDDIEIIKLEIPTVFGKSTQMVIDAIKQYRPDYVINVGQAGGRRGVTPERVAINVDDARIPDNQGQQPLNQPINRQGQAAYFSNLPIKNMVKLMTAAGIESSLSNTAGTFVCNHVMYGVLDYLHDAKDRTTKAGFIHVPYLPEQVIDKPDQPAMSLEQMTTALSLAIKALPTRDDDQLVMGEIA